eukprot:gene10351-10509_t
MLALVYEDASKTLKVANDYPKPEPGLNEALIKDIEITRGYVLGYHLPLGHEFVGTVASCPCQPDLVGQRVVGEINCNDANFTCSDVIFQRNHAPGRTVLGIINKPGCMAQYITLPASNLHKVPAALTDAEAAFCEPLAAACRILEQGLLRRDSGGAEKVAVLGDGRLGLLIAQLLAITAPGRTTHFGKHPEKMQLVKGTARQVVVTEHTSNDFQGQFDLVVEATGSAGGIQTALALTRPMGTLVLKTTVSLNDPSMPGWSELANDIVVNEKVLLGSRCGPMDVALQLMAEHAELRDLLKAMVQHEMPLKDGVEAVQLAQQKGVLKVQVVMPE